MKWLGVGGADIGKDFEFERGWVLGAQPFGRGLRWARVDVGGGDSGKGT